jgi:hypothetical protein
MIVIIRKEKKITKLLLNSKGDNLVVGAYIYIYIYEVVYFVIVVFS